jgi:hypothetical protein
MNVLIGELDQRDLNFSVNWPLRRLRIILTRSSCCIYGGYVALGELESLDSSLYFYGEFSVLIDGLPSELFFSSCGLSQGALYLLVVCDCHGCFKQNVVRHNR